MLEVFRVCHWKCDGITKQDTKAEVIASNEWLCLTCRSSKDCTYCNVKDKEIKNLRQDVIELEENITNLKSDLKIREECVTYLEDKLGKEKRLRRDLDRGMEEMKKRHKDLSSGSSSEHSSSCYETDCESSPSYKKTSLRRTDNPVKTKKKVKNVKSHVSKSSKNGDCKKKQRIINESDNRRKDGDQAQMEEDSEFTNAHLKNAINYVKEHAPEALKGTSNEDGNTTDFKSRPTSDSASDNVKLDQKVIVLSFNELEPA